jgi:hypothetical protein
MVQVWSEDTVFEAFSLDHDWVRAQILGIVEAGNDFAAGLLLWFLRELVKAGFDFLRPQYLFISRWGNQDG